MNEKDIFHFSSISKQENFYVNILKFQKILLETLKKSGVNVKYHKVAPNHNISDYYGMSFEIQGDVFDKKFLIYINREGGLMYRVCNYPPGNPRGVSTLQVANFISMEKFNEIFPAIVADLN